MLIAQITDLHIRAKGKLLHHMLPTAPYLRRCIARLEALDPRPDVVIATGDLVDRGKPKEYRRLRKILSQLTIPLYLVPGNHDDRGALREEFADHRYLPERGPLQYTIDDHPLRLIGLDTTRKRHPGAELDDDRLDWLDRRLAEMPDRPTFLFMHHPPFETGIPPIDAHGFRGLAAFARIVGRNPQIVHIACGHIHRHLKTGFAGTFASSGPSTAHQLVIDRAANGIYAIRLEAPGFVLHRWTGSTVTSSVCALDGDGLAAPPRLTVVS